MSHAASNLFSIFYPKAKRPFCILSVLLLLSFVPPAIAADQYVTTTANSGAGSFRQAVADVGTGEDVIFQSAVAGQTITLSSDLAVNRSMNFTNSSGGHVAVDLGGNQMMVTDCNSVIAVASRLTIKTTNVSSDAYVISGSESYRFSDMDGTITACSDLGDACGICCDKEPFGEIRLFGDLSGNVVASSNSGNAYGLCSNGSYGDVLIIGGLSGNVMTSSDLGNAYGVYAEDRVSISSGLSGNVTASSGLGNAYGVYAKGRVSISSDLSGVIIASSNTGEAYGLYADDDNVRINDFSGVITVNSNSENAYGCYSGFDEIEVNGDLLGAITVSSVSGNAYGFYAKYDDVNIFGNLSGAVTASSVSGNACGFYGRKLNINGNFSGAITASSGSGNAGGIYISNGIVSITGGSSSVIEATSDSGDVFGILAEHHDLNVSGDLSNAITVTSDSGNVFGILNGYRDLNVSGDLSNTITASSNSGRSYGLFVGDNLYIAGSLSGTILTNSNSGKAVAIRAVDNINGGDASIPLVITGNVMAETGGVDTAVSIFGQGINLRLEEEGTLSAIATSGTAYAIYSNASSAISSNIEFVAGCTVVGDIDLGDGADDILTLSGTDGTTTYDGDISGVETLNVTGGNWYLNGQIGCDLSITGGTLGGAAQIGNLTVDGTIAPGNSIGTLTVGGDYTQNAGSTLEIEVNDAGQSDLVDVVGTATIHGGTIEVQAESGNYTLGQTYTVLDADGGVTGTFDALFDNLANYNFMLVYNPDSVQLVLTEGSYTALAQTSNQWSVANDLDAQAGGATGDFRSIIGRFNTLSAGEARTAFNSLSGELYGSMATVGIENTDRFLRMVASRLRMRSVAGMASYATSTAGIGREDAMVARGQNAGSGMAGNRWLPWAEGYGVGAKIANDGNASGLEYSVGGVTYGFESALDDHTLFGFVAGYSKTFVDLDARDDHGEAKSAQAGVYLNHHSDVGYATGIAAYGYNAYDTWRRIQIGSLARLARAEYEGNEFSFYFETGRNYRYRAVSLQPFAALQYIQLHQNGFGETGADSVNLSIAGINADSFRSLLGTRLVGCFQTVDTGKSCTIEGRALWRHEFLSGTNVLDAQFAGQPGSFAISGVHVDRDAAILGGGLTLTLSKNAKIYSNYDLLFSQNYAAHASSAGLILAW